MQRAVDHLHGMVYSLSAARIEAFDARALPIIQRNISLVSSLNLYGDSPYGWTW
ncbi:MAG: hypothetical protein ABR923_16270 [Terracidiphilus sp.]